MSSTSELNLWRPWLWISPQKAHDLAQFLLPSLAKIYPATDAKVRSLDWKGLHFKNPMGIAGGVDKTGLCLAAWKKLGAGFLEVGTITPKPQEPNPGVILLRDTQNQALWNKMGFPNSGAEQVSKRLQNFKKNGTPLFINVGKNRWTENDSAHLDYIFCIKKLSAFADAFVINISSPNTKGLRDLLAEKELKNFLSLIRQGASDSLQSIPLLLKLSPDMSSEALEMALEVSAPYVEGWILTNTTRQRFQGSPFPIEEGGVSGQPLKELSQTALKIAASYKKRDPQKLIISAGGISDGPEILNRLEMGADLVQVYSALVFAGPSFFKDRIKELKALSPTL